MTNLASYDYVNDVPIESATFDRVHPRQMSTGSLRGAQALSGDKIVIDSSKEKIGVGKLASSTGDNPSYALSLTREGLTIADDSVDFVTLTKDGLVISDDTETRRLKAGRYSDGSIKIKLSQSTHDVTTASDDKLIWSSDFNLFKIVSSGTGTVTANWAGASPGPIQTFSTTVSHGLSSTPAVLAFANYPTAPANTYYQAPLQIQAYNAVVTAMVTDALFRVSVDSTTITFDVLMTSNVTNGSWPFRYYILKETAN